MCPGSGGFRNPVLQRYTTGSAWTQQEFHWIAMSSAWNFGLLIIRDQQIRGAITLAGVINSLSEEDRAVVTHGREGYVWHLVLPLGHYLIIPYMILSINEQVCISHNLKTKYLRFRPPRMRDYVTLLGNHQDQQRCWLRERRIYNGW